MFCNIILRGRWMLESDWLTNVLRCAIIFRETHGSGNVVPLDRITWPYHFAKWFLLFQRSYNSKTTKPTITLAKQINTVNKRIKSTDLVLVFATKLCFIVYGKHIAYSLSLSLTDAHDLIVCTLLNISANVISTTLTILSVTLKNSLRT